LLKREQPAKRGAGGRQESLSYLPLRKGDANTRKGVVRQEGRSPSLFNSPLQPDKETDLSRCSRLERG
jgi:hypothetical protein